MEPLLPPRRGGECRVTAAAAASVVVLVVVVVVEEATLAVTVVAALVVGNRKDGCGGRIAGLGIPTLTVRVAAVEAAVAVAVAVALEEAATVRSRGKRPRTGNEIMACGALGVIPLGRERVNPRIAPASVDARSLDSNVAFSLSMK